MKKSALPLIFLAAFSIPVYAVPITGSISSDSDGGMYATAGWAGGDAELSWSISESGGIWTYDYHWSTERKDLSHIILGVSETFTERNILSGTTAGWNLGWFGDEGNSNPDIPELIYGLKFGGNDTDEYFKIVTDRAPMWGNFYAKDGKDGGQDVYAYNTSFSSNPIAYTTGSSPYGYALVPDTVTTTVPEPGTVALFGLGIAGILLSRKKSS